MKPIYEEIQPSFGNSFAYRYLTENDCSNLPYWHFHPEYEIVFISNGNGQRKIGDHLSKYENGDLIFLGPNLPHLGFAQELFESHIEIVVQMQERFLGKDFFDAIELGQIKKLFKRARTGLVFYGDTKKDIGERLEKMMEFDNFSKMLELLMILQIMAYSKDCAPLNINYLSIEVKPQDYGRMQMVNEFVEKNYGHKFQLHEVAELTSMTVPAFCRFFKKLTHKTFIEFVNEFRVAQACRLLSRKHLSIAAVCFECGFNNVSHFNKLFKAITHQTPTAYRKNIVDFVQTKV